MEKTTTELVLLSGNEAVARGAYESGVRVAAAYPGTPSTEILETLAGYPEVLSEWSPNERVAFEVCFGASLAGARVLAAMKHVGLNVAADPFMTSSLTGVNGGYVLVCADDPEMHSSQNEQDTRMYARFAKVPLLEPADSQEAKDFVGEALEISERFDTPVLLRLTTRISHTKTPVRLGERLPVPPPVPKLNPKKYVMLPGNARPRHRKVYERLAALQAFSEETPLNRIEWGRRDLGIISGGIAYQYAREMIPWASFLKLGFPFPAPEDKIREICSGVDRVLVIEELEPFLEEKVRLLGYPVEGKSFFPATGELTPEKVEDGLIKAQVLPRRSTVLNRFPEAPSRPPVLCQGCPHRQIFYALKRLKATVMGDIGCYTLGALPPVDRMETCISMGASIATALGYEKVRGTSKGLVAVIGDSTFLHAGISGLLDVAYNKGTFTTIILDNRTTAMTGGQDHPATGKTLSGEESRPVDLGEICRALGVERVRVVDPYDYKATYAVLKEEINDGVPSVIITNRPCTLVDRTAWTTPYKVNLDLCDGCTLCLYVGCPAISLSETETTEKGKPKAVIDVSACTGCEFCALLCQPDAIILDREKKKIK